MISRTSLRAAALSLAVPLVLAVTASPVLATELRDDGDQPAEPLGWLMTLLIFVGIPLLVFLVLAALIWGPASAKGDQRYRPGMGWWAAPVWFNGPREGDRSQGGSGSHGQAIEASRGGAAGAARRDDGAAAATRLDVWDAASPTGAGRDGKGGTSARW